MELRHFLDLADIPSETLRHIINRAHILKKERAENEVPAHAELLRGKALAMIFEKNSTRTRVSFEVGMIELGGQAIMLSGRDTQLGRGETIADTARALSRYVDVIMLRCHSHVLLCELAEHAQVPIINGLTDYSHPCQILADIMTFEEWRGSMAGKTVAWVGDGNNVCNSFITAAAAFQFKLRIATPDACAPDAACLKAAHAKGADVRVMQDSHRAVQGAHMIVTDTWVSMGVVGEEAEQRRTLLAPYQVNAALMKLAHPDAVFMHCLPAHRGEEVTTDIIDGPQSAVWDEAENRLHVQKSILLWALGR